MTFIQLNENESLLKNNHYVQLREFIKELQLRELPLEIIQSINKDLEEINTTALNKNQFNKLIKNKQTQIIELLEKELKIVPKNYYQTLWLALGMAAFGIPIGVAFGLNFGNMAYLGIGLPIGMAIGIALGSQMDKKALVQGRQLNIEIKY